MSEIISLNELVSTIKLIFTGKVRLVIWHKNTVTGWLVSPQTVLNKIDIWELCCAFCDKTNSRNEKIRVDQLQVFGTTEDDDGNITARKQVYNLGVCGNINMAVLVEDYTNVDKEPPKWIGFN